MLAGTLVFDDIVINYHHVYTTVGNSSNFKIDVKYMVCDSTTGEAEYLTATPEAFAATLSIAVSLNGKASDEDYKLAESIQGEIRWIP